LKKLSDLYLFLTIFIINAFIKNLNFYTFFLWQEFEQQQVTRWIGYVDWRNRPALRGKHGGMLAASFVLGMSQISHFDES
jgi:hypothetical protein